MESRVEIERDDEVPSVDRKLLDRGDVLHSGIVDEDIHTAKAFSRFRHHRLDRVDFRQIGVAVDRARAANRLQPGAFRLYGIGIAKAVDDARSEEHTSELQSLMRISYAVFCLKTKINLHTT